MDRVCPKCCYPCRPAQFRGPSGKKYRHCRLCRARQRYQEAANDIRLELLERDMEQREHRKIREREEAICH